MVRHLPKILLSSSALKDPTRSSPSHGNATGYSSASCYHTLANFSAIITFRWVSWNLEVKRDWPHSKSLISSKKERGSHLGQNFLISLKQFDPQLDRADQMNNRWGHKKGFCPIKQLIGVLWKVESLQGTSCTSCTYFKAQVSMGSGKVIPVRKAKGILNYLKKSTT